MTYHDAQSVQKMFHVEQSRTLTLFPLLADNPQSVMIPRLHCVPYTRAFHAVRQCALRCYVAVLCSNEAQLALACYRALVDSCSENMLSVFQHSKSPINAATCESNCCRDRYQRQRCSYAVR